MNTQKYEAFLKTAELGSLPAAAKALGYTQTELSRTLSGLERSLGVDLLIRDKGEVRLTASGGRLYPLIRDLVAADRSLSEEIGEILQLQSGLVRIGTVTSVSVHILPRLIHDFNQLYPGIDFTLLHGTYSQIESWLLQGRIDVGFLRTPVKKRLQGYPLGQDRLLIVMPQNHPCAGEESFPLSRLGDEPFILLEDGEESEVEEVFAKCGVTSNVRLRVWDDYAIISMVESGLGISLMPELALRRTPYDVVVKELEQPEYRKLALAVRAGIRLSPAVSRFLSYSQEHCDFLQA